MRFALLLSAILIHRHAQALSSFSGDVSRRSALGILSSSPFLLSNTAAAHATERRTTEARDALLSAISRGASEEVVLSAVNNLIPLDPSQGKGATMPNRLEGEWKLLWSCKAEAFSPLLQLPPPLKPMSFQYLGNAAATEVGVDRVAQGLTGGVLLDKQLWLSSGVAPSTVDPSVLDILPPFRLQLGGRPGTDAPKQTLVESGSDAEFRANAINSRTKEAQLAPKNAYQQLYVEESDGPGAIRISTVASGDPVIVGAIFVHQKL